MISIKKLTLFIGVLFLAACSSDNDAPQDIKVQSITINNATAITDGLSKQLSANVLPSDATDKTVTWSVSDPTIAAITQTGMLTPLKDGTVSVDVTANDGSGIAEQVTIVITGVKGEVILANSVTVAGANITDGKPQQLTVEVLPANTTNKEVTWSVSSANAIISADGILTPKLNGTVTIYATANDGSGKVGSIQLTISGVTTVYATKTRSESILIWQRTNGGWGKAVADLNDYNLVQTDVQKAIALRDKNLTDTTIDNGHVTTELRWLLADYKTTKNPNYLAAAEKAIDFLFKAQYANGGWPQYFPLQTSTVYRNQITYNDDAIVKVMNVMWDISKKQKDLEQVDAKYVPLSVTAFNKGIDVMVKSQITSPSGKKTAWCAQHDEVTLKPALARAYELPSISGSESVGIVTTLMLVENPSAEVKQAVKAAMEWFDSAKIVGYATQNTGTDVVVISSPGNIMWARFYDLNTGLPFFCGRDGIKKNTLAEIELERRTGYAWYGNWPSKITTSYNSWKSKHGL